MKRATILTAACTGLLIGGCAQTKHHHHDRPSPEPASAPATSPSTQPGEAETPASPEILQQRTQSYAESMQQLMHPPATTQPGPTAATAPVAPEPAPEPAVAPSTPPPQLEAVPTAPPPSVQVAINPPSAPRTQPDQQVAAAQPAGESLTQRIDQQAHDQPRDAAAQLDQQLLAFVRGDSVPDENTLAPLSSNEREVLSALLDGLTNYRDVIKTDPTATTARKLQPLLDMADRIHAQADLAIPAISLCTAVRSFGDYDVMNADALPSDQVTQALVYCQVTNFASQLTNQQWETHFSERLALYSEQTGKAVWTKPPQPIADRCKQRRHDCYCVERIDIPAGLPTGKYVLSVTIEDQISNKLTQATIPIGIKAE